MSAHRELRVEDLPQWLMLVMLTTQSVLGLLVGMLLGRVVRRVFLAGYATVAKSRPPVQVGRTRV